MHRKSKYSFPFIVCKIMFNNVYWTKNMFFFFRCNPRADCLFPLAFNRNRRLYSGARHSHACTHTYVVVCHSRQNLLLTSRCTAVTLPYNPGEGSGARTIHYWAPPGEPRLPPLLLIHGFGPMATWQWRRQVGPFSLHFHVVVPDLLCFGGSAPCPSSPPPSESAQAAALAALLDALPGLPATARVAVAGTSYGGFVSYSLARAAGPARVGPVVISNSSLLKTAEDDRAFLERAGGEWASTAELLMPLDARSARRLMELSFYRKQFTAMLPDFIIREAVQKLFSDKREEKIELMKAITVGTDEFQLTPLEQDVLLIWGDHDQIFPLDKAFAVKRCLGENVRLEIFKETGHVPQMEDPNRFNEVVLDFLLASQMSPNQHDQ